MENRLHSFILLFFLLSIPGCGARFPEDIPPFRSCTIHVLDGEKPVSGVDVGMLLEGGRIGLSIGGTTDKNGMVKVRTILGDRQKTGAPQGEYRIALFQVINWPPDLVLGPDKELSLSPAAFAELDARRRRFTEENDFLPPILMEPERTPLRLTVSGKKNDFTVDISQYR